MVNSPKAAVKQLKPGTIFSYLVSFVIALFIFLAIESLSYTLFGAPVSNAARSPHASRPRGGPSPSLGDFSFPPPHASESDVAEGNTTEADVDEYAEVDVDGYVRDLELSQNASLDELHHAQSARSDSDFVSGFDVTLITQCSEDRAEFLLHIIERWEGPISASIFIVTPDGEANITAAIEAAVGDAEREINVHFVTQAFHGQPYPVNKLRNIAIQAVTTTHFMVTDVDLWPSRTLYSVILKQGESYLSKALYTMVVPAFEISSTIHKAVGHRAVPDTFEGLKLCADRGLCDIFKHSTDTHTSTWYKKWWAMTEDESAYKIPCFDSIRYEPYLLVPKTEETPPFDERFVGYGKNKIQFVQHLRLLGFQFFVLPAGFVIHVPHTYSKSRHSWSASNRAKKNQLFMSFMREKMNGAKIRVPLCMQAFVQMSQDEYS